MDRAADETPEYKVQYPKASYGIDLYLTIFDDIDVAIRTTIAVVTLGCICLYEDEETVLDEYPLCFLMLVVALALSLVPFAGAVLSHGASFLWGAFLATIAVIVVTKILGDSVEEVLVPFPAAQTCIYSPNPLIVPANTSLPAMIPIPPFNSTTVFIDLEGDLGDPSPYWLGVLIAVGTFLFVFLGESKFFILGSVIVYNFYLATWYTATQTALRPIPGVDEFFRYTRTILIGVAFALASFLLPLPKLLPTFIPQPRFGCSVIFSQLGRVATALSNNFADIITLFEYMHRSENKQEMLAATQARFILCQKILDENTLLLRKLLKVLKLAAQYEPLWFPLPLPHFTTVDRIKKTIFAYQALIMYEGAMIRALENYAAKSTIQSEVDGEFMELLNEFAKDVEKISDFHILGNPFFCTYDDIHSRFEEHSNTFKDRASHYFQEKNEYPDESHSKEAKIFALGFHTYFFWCMHGVADTVIEIDKLRKLPSNKALGLLLVFLDWPLHLLGWFLEYIMMLVNLLKEILFLVQCRKRYGPIKFFQRHYSRVFGSLIVSLAALVAFLFILIDDWRTRLPTATTVVIMAVVTIDRDQPSGGFRNAILRLAGTTLGIATAFCIVIFFDDTPEDGLSDDPIIISMMIFCLIGRLVMQNQKYLFFAYTFIVTNIILLFAISVDLNTFVGFSGLRAVAIGIGISISTFCMILWPVRASLRLRRTIGQIVDLCQQVVINSLTGSYTEKKINSIYESIQKKTFQQEIMHDNAEFEPDLFSRPFPSKEYFQIVNIERLLIRDSLIIAELMKLLRGDTGKENSLSTVGSLSEEDFQNKLSSCFKIIIKRCKTPYLEPSESQLQLYETMEEFKAHLPQPEEIMQMEKPSDIIASCALLFCFYNLLQDLQEFNLSLTNLVAHRIASKPPSIPLRIPAAKLKRKR